MSTGHKKWQKARTFNESYSHAWRGLARAVRTERNFRIQLIGLVLVMAAGWWLGVSAIGMAILLSISTLVLALELVNTAVEMLADVVRPQYHDTVGGLKDVAAAAVLIASGAAILVGLLVFGPIVVG